MAEKHVDQPSETVVPETIDAFVDTRDLAAQYGVNESSFVRRLDYKLLPALSFLYLLSFLDRSNVGNAKIEGLAKDIHMTGNEYLFGLTIFFLGYVLFEIPAQIILKLWTPRMWLPTITVAWGIVATLIGVVHNKSGFYAIRFFLGLTEAGLFPGIVYYLSMWYKRNERQYRVALFFSAASLAGAFGGILAWGIAHMNGVGHYKGWRWIFIIEGLFTIVVGVAAYFFIHNYPATAKFLSPTEKEFIQARLEADSDATQIEGFSWIELRKAFTDIKVYLYCFAYHTVSLPLYGLSLFLPTIIKDLGYTSAHAQLLTVPPYAFAFILTVTVAMLSQKTHKRAVFIIGSSAFAIIGYILLLTTSKAGVKYTGMFFAAGGIYPAVALVLAWPANNVSGQSKRAIAGGMQIMIGNCGGLISTQIYRPATAPHYYLGHGVALVYLVGNIAVVTILYFVLKRTNEKRDALLRSGQITAHTSNDLSDSASDEEKQAKRRASTGSRITADFRGDDDIRWRFHL